MTTSYVITLLKFRTPVHFGAAGLGGGLEEAEMICRADTFFSALCQEAALQGAESLDRLITACQSGKVRFSDLMPYCEAHNEYELYLPRPCLPPDEKTEENQACSLTAVRQVSGQRKKIKKRQFLRATELLALRNGKLDTMDLPELPSFGEKTNDVHFNSRTRKPYDVGAFHFQENAGLYLVIALENEEDRNWLAPLIYFLGLSGIGGRKSSGLGHFDLIDGEDPASVSGSELEYAFSVLNEYGIYGKDDAALYQLLNASNDHWQMTIAPVLPSKEDIPAAADGFGQLLRRCGYAYSKGMETAIRTDSVYMMNSGSCFRQRLTGRIADVNPGNVPHPVYKYGKGLYLGVKP